MPAFERRLFVRSNPEALASIRAFAREFCGEAGVPADLVPRLVLAIDEACANVIRHAYGGASGRPIDVTLRLEPAPEPALVTVVRDEGERRPDLERIAARPLGRCEPGGYGSQFMCAIMDEVEYDVSGPVGTTLRMVKRLGTSARHPPVPPKAIDGGAPPPPPLEGRP